MFTHDVVFYKLFRPGSHLAFAGKGHTPHSKPSTILQVPDLKYPNLVWILLPSDLPQLSPWDVEVGLHSKYLAHRYFNFEPTTVELRKDLLTLG